MAEENENKSDMERDNRPARDWKPSDSPSGADPTLDDDLEEKEKELRKITRDQNGPRAKPQAREDGVEDTEGLVAQATDPEAQES
jgi:hypothetical protein